MSEFRTSDDDAVLLARLRRGLEESDSVPSDVTEFARAVISWRDIDAELAGLEFDSNAQRVPGGVRSSTTARMMSFQAGQWMIDIEYDETSGRLIGAISPEAAYAIELHTAGAFFVTQSDERGHFSAEGIVTGPLGMVLRFEDGQVVKTQWVVL